MATLPRSSRPRTSPTIEWFGWYGVVATILAYALVSFAVLPPTSLWYQGLNFTGALGVTVETWYHKDYQPFWLNLIWAIIALIAIGGIIRSFYG